MIGITTMTYHPALEKKFGVIVAQEMIGPYLLTLGLSQHIVILPHLAASMLRPPAFLSSLAN